MFDIRHRKAARCATGAAVVSLALIGSGELLKAQKDVEVQKDVVMARSAKAAFHGMPFDVDLKPVAGAPFSAEAITETVQTLADGNRIVQRHTASVARDGQGRTRRDQVLAALGPMAPEQQPRTVFIHDPVAGAFYILDPERQTARKGTMSGEGGMTFYSAGNASGSGAAGTVTSFRVDAVRGGAGVPRRVEAVPAVPAGADPAHTIAVWAGSASMAKPETESLGTQVIEGVEATGTRTIVTIAAGEIGNEQPIKIVSERWYSPEIQTTVLTTRTDPRMGETIYRLTNIARGEPASSLFEVPAGYTISDDFAMPRKMPPPPPPPPR